MYAIATERELENLLKEYQILVLDFWAPWCPPCKPFGKVLEAASERHPGVAFSRINTNEEEEISASFGVSTLPMLVVIRDGVMVARREGYLDDTQLDELLRQVSDLDMDSIRAEAKPSAAV